MSRISSAVLVQMKGLGSLFHSLIQMRTLLDHLEYYSAAVNSLR